MLGDRYFRTALVALLLGSSAPAISQSAPPPLSSYGELPAFEEAALSPSGNIAVLGTVNGERMVLVLDPALTPLNAVKVADMKVRSIGWAGDEHLVIIRSDTYTLDQKFAADKAELSNMMIVPLDAAKPVKVVFGDDRRMAKAIFSNYSLRRVDGRWTAFVGGVPLKETPSGGGYTFEGGPALLYAVDLETNKHKIVARPGLGGVWRSWMIDPDGNIALTMDWKEGSGDWSLVNRAGKEIAAGNHPKGQVGLIAFGESGTTAIYSQDDENDEAVWFEVPLDGSKPAVEIFPGDPIDDYFLEPGTGRLTGYRPDDSGDDVLFLDSARQGKAADITKAFAGSHPRLQGWTPDFNTVLLRTNGNGDSGTWYTLDVANKQSKRIGTERPRIGASVGPISTVNYVAEDGTELDGILTLPPGRPAKNLPVIILPHGGPHSHDVEGFDWWAQAFASRGYAVFQPNFRGSTNKDEAFRQASYGQWGRKMQTDLSDGLAELVKLGIADPKRACIMGASYGGYAALAGVTVQNGVYRCAVAVAGVSDLRMMYDTDMFESGRNRFLKANRQEELGDLDKLGEISPRRLAAKADAPILLIHGRDDTVVPYRHSQVMADALNDAGKPYEMVQLVDEDHWLSRASTRMQMLAAAVAFVQKYNPPD
jgi:dipeptidyl aminopeptidase/acylaminoacyl peptidase